MKVTVYGSGYVGLVVAACLAEVGNDVLCMDVNQQKINQLLQGVIPIYEPGLQEIVQAAMESGCLKFTTDVLAAVKHGLCQFIAVGTPPDAEGKADLSYVWSVAQAIGSYREDYTIIINKSTVPIGTGAKVQAVVKAGQLARGCSIPFDVVMNPEFLKEGAALEDFRKPARIILGVESSYAENILKTLYAPFSQHDQCLMIMDLRSAELTKYAANAMLATKISFMNEMANLAEKVGADIEKVRLGIGADPRIGPHFINPGCGYGGSCFGKDVQALMHTAKEVDCSSEIIQAVEQVNTRQKHRIFDKMNTYFQGGLKDKTFAIWGLAFKPETDDMRDAPSLVIVEALLAAGAKIQAYDPQAMKEAKKIWGRQPHLIFGANAEEVLEGAHALVVLTEWRAFRSPDFKALKEKLLHPLIFDGRNMYDPVMLKGLGIVYYGIGRDNVASDEDKIFSRQKVPAEGSPHSETFAECDG